MAIDLPLASMSTAEKLAAMEAIWADLSQHPDELESPQWHGDVLAARAKRLAEGKTGFTDWEAAKEEIRKQAHEG